MSSTVEDRRQEQVQLQKTQTEQKTAKEREVSAQKFKATIAGKVVSEQKTQANQKEAGQKQSFNQNLMMARNGIAGRNLAERLVKNQEGSEKADKELTGAREKDLKSDSERVDSERSDAKAEAQDAQVAQQQFDAPIKNEEDKQRGEGQGQQGQGQNSGGQQHGHQSQQGDQKDDKSGVGGIGGAGKAAASGGAGKAGEAGAPSATKIAIGKTTKAAAAERIPTQVMQGVVDKVAVMCAQNMGEFQIQLKDDAMGGGTLRVTLKDKKIKIAFTLKDASTKNLLESQKGLLMRMFERKGLALESMTVSVRT